MKIIKFLQKNHIPFLFALVAVIIEYTAVFVTTSKPYIRNPWIFLSLIGLLTVAQFFFRSDKVRHIFSSAILTILFVCDLVFIVIYEMTGTIFDFSMLNLRGDAMAILESVPINFAYTVVGGLALSGFIVFGRALSFKEVAERKYARRTAAAVFAAVLICHGILVCGTVAKASGDLKDKIYQKAEGGYADRGIIGNFIAEMYQGAFDDVEVGSKDEIRDFIYSEISSDDVPYFGAAEGYNVVTVLAESFEWFSFVNDELIYPNGHKADETVLRELYPNLYDFYDSSVVMTDFHSREKTDISENLSLIGNYPMDYYLNYDYPENNIAYSVPNVMKNLYGVESISFHNGTTTFYNRDEYLPTSVGFKKFVSSEHMTSEYMTNYIELGERNLDSEMVQACKEDMFPTDRRFNTYITTITMHGQYAYRENLRQYYDKLDSYGLLPLQTGNTAEAENANAFRYYAAAAMEFDAAIGVMMDHLEETGLIDNTLIVVFGDHNVYYQALSNYVKDIYPQTDKTADVPELYRVPMMIKIGSQIQETIKVDKFTCTADIYPTIMSLLGIRYYSNLFYGHSVFDEQESILYSRAYDVFMTDKVYFTSLDNIVYSENADKIYMKEIENRALTLMEKVSYINRIFATDFFTGIELQTFNGNMKEINAR